MLQKLLKDTELKDVIVYRYVEPRYVDITRKIFFREKTIKVQDGECAIYVVKRDYVSPILKVCVVCGDNVTAQDISVFNGVVDPKYWTKMNLSDQEKIETWREVKNLYETEQKKRQEPNYWKKKLENIRNQTQQQKDVLIKEILDMLCNVHFTDQGWGVYDISYGGCAASSIGAVIFYGCGIKAKGCKFSYYFKGELRVHRIVDDELILSITMDDSQGEKFKEIHRALSELDNQRKEARYERELAEERTKKLQQLWEEENRECQKIVSMRDSFWQNVDR